MVDRKSEKISDKLTFKNLPKGVTITLREDNKVVERYDIK